MEEVSAEAWEEDTVEGEEDGMSSNSRVYGIVPSKRLGRSLGVSPIPFKTCTYSCVYCQLGRTTNFTVKRQTFFPLKVFEEELKGFVKRHRYDFDVVSIVGEGEPTLYTPLDALIDLCKSITGKPVVLITNGSLFWSEKVRKEAKLSDIIMPTLSAWDEKSFRTIHKPHKNLSFQKVFEGLKKFRREYSGEIWLEVMLVKGLNDFALEELKEKISQVESDRVYVNVPVRPPAEGWVEPPDEETIEKAKELFNAASIETPAASRFIAAGEGIDAVLNVIKRHPMNEEEVRDLLTSQKIDPKPVLEKLRSCKNVKIIEYSGRRYYRYTTAE